MTEKVKVPIPSKAIRAFCMWCADNNRPEIKDCLTKKCSLYPYRVRKRGRITLKVIKLKCRDCVGTSNLQSNRLIRECDFDGVREDLCPLYPYRLGKRPETVARQEAEKEKRLAKKKKRKSK